MRRAVFGQDSTARRTPSASSGGVAHRDVQDVFVVDVEDLWHEPGADGVGPTEIAIDRDPHDSILPPAPGI
jgi:hypothetical protein